MNTNRNEQAVADLFNRALQVEALKKGCNFRSFSLGGQDVIAGADYLLTDHNRFSLVEFKYEEDQIYDEAKKCRRLTLCRKIEINSEMKCIHDLCHFIAWQKNWTMQCNIYRFEVCNESVFGPNHGLSSKHPFSNRREEIVEFSNSFFQKTNSRSVDLVLFEKYIKWVIQETSGSKESSLSLLTYDNDSNSYANIHFPSVRKAYEWMQSRNPSPSNSYTKGP